VTSGELSLRFRYAWEPVLDDGGRPLVYPGKLGAEASGRLEGPAIYRWVLKDGDEVTAAHIGSTGNLSRRLYQYQNPSDPRSDQARVKRALTQEALFGGEAFLEALRLDSLQLGERNAAPGDLRDPAVRSAVERLLAWETKRCGIKTLGEETQQPRL
jgi:hypothetical protein